MSEDQARTRTRVLPKPRRVRFPMPTSTKRQHFVDGDLVMSHFISVLSATFPEGEDFFIRSVRNFQSSIDDPQLDTAVKGFIGQEATHRHQHRLLNERLQVMGYPTARIDRHVARLIKRLERRFSPEMRLSMTSALEHYTATLAKSFLPAKTPRSSSDRQRFDRFCCGMPSRSRSTKRLPSMSIGSWEEPSAPVYAACGSLQ